MNHRDTELTEMKSSTISCTRLRQRLKSVLTAIGENEGEVVFVQRRGKKAATLISETRRQRLMKLVRGHDAPESF